MQMDSDFSTRGVPIHADHATVSLNLFATPDDGRVDGGGLQLYHVLPEDGLKSEEYNFPPHYWAIEQNRKVLDSYEKVTIPYAYNRAPEAFFYAVGAIALCHGKDSATVPLSE